MAELLLELFSEEIPARMQARAADDLKRLVCDGLKATGLAFAEARAFATPRRLALVVDGLPVAREDVSEERRGPRVGAPDHAIQGFLKGAGLASLDQAEKRDTGKGEFWFAVIIQKGGPTGEALPGIIESAMKALPWPKSMKWGSGTMQWVRPLQSIVALFNGKVLAGEVAPGGAMKPIRFGDSTRGHRFLSKGDIRVADFTDYVTQLKNEHVILDAFERQSIIMNGAEKLCREAGTILLEDDALLEEVAGLVEWPVPLLGRIDEEFLNLPYQVLVSSMRTHQRYFPTWKRELALASRFVVIANNVTRDDGAKIIEGNERVLRARLSDAKFFWDQDRKQTLESRLPSLKQVVFHAKLGTQSERVDRLVKLASVLAKNIPGAEPVQVEQAARLAKADLVTGMVGEFPELQGIIGGYYAMAEKLPMPVVNAIQDHYAPAGPKDRCPSAPVSIAVALADKLDALVSFWSIGEKPTGSRDPFGLRRAALGCIRLILENNLRVPLSEILSRHHRLVSSALDWNSAYQAMRYFVFDVRRMEEERHVFALIDKAIWKSYLSDDGLLDRAKSILESHDTWSLKELMQEKDLIELRDRLEDIFWASDAPIIKTWLEGAAIEDAEIRESFARVNANIRRSRDSLVRAHEVKYLTSLLDFFAERLKVQMREKGVRHDVVDAVLALGDEGDLVRLLARVEALQSFLKSEAGSNLLMAYGRAANIVRAEQKKDKELQYKLDEDVDVVLLGQDEEKIIYWALIEAKRAVEPALSREDFAGAMNAFAGLRAPIDAFFDKVTVNVTDKPELRLNRLKLLNQIRATMDSVADFSKIEG